MIFFVRRLISGFVVLILVVLLVSSIIFLAPVDPAQLTFGQRVDVSTVKAKTAELGLDQPLYIQLIRYLGDLSPISLLPNQPEVLRKYCFIRLLSINNHFLVLKWPYLRESYQSGRKVSELLSEALPSTVLLATAAMILASILGVFIGVISALNKSSWIDRLLNVLAVFGYSVPSYVAALLLALVFAYFWGSWTGLSVQGSLFVLNDFGEWQWQWRNLILPALALGIRPLALISQLTRGAMLDVLSQDYIRTATAKGLSRAKVVSRHALRNAMNPIVSALSGWFASLLTGAFFVETVFNFRGLGDLTVNALINYDVPVVLGCLLVTSAIFIGINIFTDMLYRMLDPRVNFS